MIKYDIENMTFPHRNFHQTRTRTVYPVHPRTPPFVPAPSKTAYMLYLEYMKTEIAAQGQKAEKWRKKGRMP